MLFINALFKEKCFRTEDVLAGNIIPQGKLCVFIQTYLFTDPLKVFDLTDAELKFLQACRKQGRNGKCDDLSVGLHAAISHQLCTHLGDFL